MRFKNKNTQGVILRINSPGRQPVAGRDHLRRIAACGDLPQRSMIAVGSGHLRLGRILHRGRPDKIFVDKARHHRSYRRDHGRLGLTAHGELGVERRALTSGEEKAFLDRSRGRREAEAPAPQSMLDRDHKQFIDS